MYKGTYRVVLELSQALNVIRIYGYPIHVKVVTVTLWAVTSTMRTRARRILRISHRRTPFGARAVTTQVSLPPGNRHYRKASYLCGGSKPIEARHVGNVGVRRALRFLQWQSLVSTIPQAFVAFPHALSAEWADPADISIQDVMSIPVPCVAQGFTQWTNGGVGRYWSWNNSVHRVLITELKQRGRADM